jgi:RNA polymerase sigma factor (sigma-70 family)
VSTEIHRIIDTIWRMESAQLIASLARIVRDVGLAEELAQDALVIALEKWPESGVPDNPGAWLMVTAKHRAIDALRRQSTLERKHTELAREIEIQQTVEVDADAVLDDQIGDDLLRLIFISCHPVLSAEARSALTLRLLGGLSTAEIARAFLTSEATVAQRIVRAKRTLAEAEIAFEVPPPEEFPRRLASVLEVIYLIFNEGYLATSGEDLVRPSLCEEALRLGWVLAGLVPDEPEVHGLVALMEIQASRTRARVGPAGEPVLLADQNRRRWDQLLIGRGLAALERAEKLGGARGVYALQAAIAACHARASSVEETDWRRITELYAGRGGAVPGSGVESGNSRGNGLRSCRRPRIDRCFANRALAQGLPPVAERARRPARKAWSICRGPTRVRAGRLPGSQSSPARLAARSSGRMQFTGLKPPNSGPG